MKWLLYVMLLAGCDSVFRIETIPPLPDGAMTICGADNDVDGSCDAGLDGHASDGARIDALHDGDTSIDAPLDAFACATHNECAAMMPGMCCVDPGSTGHCEMGIIIATVCMPQ